ncbi:DUF4446 family protein [Nocardiopsis changdeensis]|uniref:DUF4446 family protein n=1 Tax=Nocardiopsis changdeensis TaxID=2831969 RepID=A0ABX8BKW4_9ACTN|nr:MULTISPECIES: DUF4446 family protein [Nocardiopsis]QUX22880.1 DUF4446 family protein [Nocardiopsis changdeensis]QYX38822.1 DUF4446 family protein [Nocardiopsis sp. MT53]
MFTMILAVTGVLTGLGGLALGGYALARARAIDADTRVLAQRAAASAQVGGTDPLAVRDMAVLHYDALEEMSGARSFSLALLNGDGDGVVVTSINGRTESRTYAKAVVRGESETLLSPEEYRVVRAARLGEGIGTTVPAPRVSGPVVAEDAEDPVTVVPDPEAPEPGGEAVEKGDAEPAEEKRDIVAVPDIDADDTDPRPRTGLRRAPAPRSGPE